MHLVTSQPSKVVQRHQSGLVEWLLGCVHTLRAGQGREAKRQMRVVETLALGGRKQLVLVSCAGERFLVGTGPEQVQTIVRVRPEAAGAARLREERS